MEGIFLFLFYRLIFRYEQYKFLITNLLLKKIHKENRDRHSSLSQDLAGRPAVFSPLWR